MYWFNGPGAPPLLAEEQPGWFIGKFGTNGFQTEMDLKTGELAWVVRGYSVWVFTVRAIRGRMSQVIRL
jgi:hypothetical protein